MKIFKKASFTLLEILIVVIIVGIMAGVAVPGFLGARQKAIDREARINLKLIQTAEKTHELESGAFVACADNNACNTALNLDLPPSVANGGNWTYDVALTVTGFDATATGTSGSQATWTIDEDDDEAQ